MTATTLGNLRSISLYFTNTSLKKKKKTTLSTPKTLLSLPTTPTTTILGTRRKSPLSPQRATILKRSKTTLNSRWKRSNLKSISPKKYNLKLLLKSYKFAEKVQQRDNHLLPAPRKAWWCVSCTWDGTKVVGRGWEEWRL